MSEKYQQLKFNLENNTLSLPDSLHPNIRLTQQLAFGFLADFTEEKKVAERVIGEFIIPKGVPILRRTREYRYHRTAITQEFEANLVPNDNIIGYQSYIAVTLGEWKVRGLEKYFWILPGEIIALPNHKPLLNPAYKK